MKKALVIGGSGFMGSHTADELSKNGYEVTINKKKYSLEELKVKNILVTEYHRIGDVIIIAPILKSIKNKFPNSNLILICNKQVAHLANHLNLADEIIGLEVPWTNWDWSMKKWFLAYSFSKKIRTKKIDLAFDFKGDFRNSWFLWKMNPKISFGYDHTGGGYFFSNPQKMSQKTHQQKRAFNLVKKVGCLNISFKKISFRFNEGSLVVHPGAIDIRRAWPDSHWIQFIKRMVKHHKISVVEVESSKKIIKKLKKESFSLEVFSGDLIEYNEWLKKQKLIVAPDSMAGHLAAFNRIPSISIFGSQDPTLTRPLSVKSMIVAPDQICNHRRDHWRLCAECMSSINVEKVYTRARTFISNLKNQR